MTSIVTDFKSISKKLNRMEQKAEFEEKNPPVELSMYGYPSNLNGTVPYCWRRVNAELVEYAIATGRFGDEFVKLSDGSSLSRPLVTD